MWGAFTHRFLAICASSGVGGPNPRTIATLLVVAAMGWAVWTSRRGRDLWLWAGLSARSCFTPTRSLAVQVHSHLFAAVRSWCSRPPDDQASALSFMWSARSSRSTWKICSGIGEEDAGWRPFPQPDYRRYDSAACCGELRGAGVARTCWPASARIPIFGLKSSI